MYSKAKEIKSISFGILSEEEIVTQSVSEITKNKLSSHSGQLNYNTVYDPRMGPMELNQVCETCERKTKDCPGHFGHIMLNTKIIHPLYVKQVTQCLRCFCIRCSRLLVTMDHIELWNIHRLKGEQRFLYLAEKLSTVRFCVHCSLSQPKYTVSTLDNSYHIVYNDQRIKLCTDDIYSRFIRIPDEDIVLAGFNPDRMRPVHLILTALPVLPPRSRPFVMSESINDDDLTISYCEIIKLNNCLSATMTDLKLQKCIDMLAFRIKTLFDNTGGKAKHTSTKPFKGFKERLSGKDGLIRNNLMGKRVNFSARTVIGPDPTLELDQIAVPEDICSILSYAENVNSFNRKHLQEMIWKKQVNMIDRIMPDGQLRRIHIKFALSNPNTDLRDELCTIKNGDIVHRQIQTGDIVLLNRQPTLHRGSMLAKRIIRRKTKTICMNLATTSTFNADFDGDEMNLFFPQNEMSKSELKLLSSTPNNMMGAQSSQSVISIVQDALLSLFLMTKSTEQIPKSDFFQLLFPCNLSWKHIDRKLNQMQCEGYNAFTGKGLFSMILPFDLEYTSYNKADIHEPTVVIQKGLLVSGVLNKMNLKGGHSSLICLFHKYYSKEIACDFVNQSQFLAIAYITRRGFSIGIGDTLTQTESRQLPVVIEKCFFEASEYEKSIHNERVKEAKINLALSKAKDIGMKLATDALGNENNFIQTVRAGSKGDYFNIAQIMGLVGQQNIGGSRIRPQLNQGKRTLPHYFFQEEDLTRKYESRGFIRNSFLKGLSPQEFWFHAMSGREGITDTAMKTAQSGYTQRKMVKIMEDVQVKYDQTVRNSFGSIIQFAYGGDNLCPTKMVLVQDEMNDKKPFFCDVSKLADRLNCD